jgi:hypothetical protein
MAAHADAVIPAAIAPSAAAGAGASRYTTEGETARVWWGHLLFGLGAGVVGFLCAFVFATTLELSRPLFVLCYAAVATPFLVTYVKWSGTRPLRLIRKHWLWGVAGAVVVGAFLVRNVLTQDPSPRPEGVSLVGDVLWLGVVYGVLDALMLSVVPVLATWRAFKTLGWTQSWAGKAGVLGLALVVSLIVTFLYHLGFSEYWGSGIKDPLVGNGIMSLGYIATANPLTAVLSHIAMHVSAVLHGFTSAVQLPPHF